MPDTILAAPPFILVKPQLIVGTAGSGFEYECSANEVDANVDQDSTDNETFCGIFTSYKPEKWTITVTVLQSYGTAGFWNLIRPLCGTVVPFSILPTAGAAVGASNPKMTGTAYVKAFPFLSAAVGEASDFDFVLDVQGVPTFPLTFEAAEADYAAATEVARAWAEGKEVPSVPNGATNGTLQTFTSESAA